MERTIAAIALAMFANTLQAETVTEKCTGVGELAQEIMEARQEGVALSTMMKIVEGNAFWSQVVMDAFNKPRYSSTEFQNEEAQDFRAEIEIICFNSFGDGV